MILSKFSFVCFFLWAILLQSIQAQVVINKKTFNYGYELSDPQGIKMSFNCQYPVLEFYNFTRNTTFTEKAQQRLLQELQTQILTLPSCLNSKRHEHLQSFADGIFDVAKNTNVESHWDVILDTFPINIWQIRRSLTIKGSVWTNGKGGAKDAIWLDIKGKKLGLQDVFEATELAKMRLLLVSKAKKQFQLQESQNIETVLWVSDTTLFMPQIFWVEHTNFNFYYCKKEIAPNELGDILLTLSRSELAAILPKEHRIFKMLAE